MSRCRRSLRATRAPCLAKSDQGERRGGGGSGTAGHPAVCRPAPHGKAHFVGFGGRRVRLSVTSPPGRCGTKPPASLRGTMENGPTGQTCSSNPPPGCGGVAPSAAAASRRASGLLPRQRPSSGPIHAARHAGPHARSVTALRRTTHGGGNASDADASTARWPGRPSSTPGAGFRAGCRSLGS